LSVGNGNAVKIVFADKVGRLALVGCTMKILIAAVLAATTLAIPVAAQNVHVEARRQTGLIPKACESVVPATLETQVDIGALVKEVNCKGSGDMVSQYTYVLKSVKREKDKKGQTKEEAKVYEVYMPVLPNGTHAHGVLLATSRNGVPVPPDELAKERLRAGERLEKEEKELARSASSQPSLKAESAAGMLPLGTYPSVKTSSGKFGTASGSAVVDIHTILNVCELTLLRHEQNEGREMLVFGFTARPNAQLDSAEKYVMQLKGLIWIDEKERIVTRLKGWPANTVDQNVPSSETSLKEPPAVYVEMMRLPTGTWLPSVVRINGVDYPKLFDHISYEAILSYSDFVRFNSEVKDVKVEAPKGPR
jgi:hypothetical protein